jgi:opacity protein-like surface antigen
MKILTTSILASLALIGTSLAGDTYVSSGKSYKQTAAAPPAPGCFSDQELQIDTFGQASFGSNEKIGLFQENAWGGGVGLNYFFHRNIGIGVDAAWLSAKHSDLGNQNAGDSNDERTVLHNFSGSVIFRYPIESACIAPYAYVGGGYHVDGEDWASAHGGVGVEYRVVPRKVGLFVDGRWTYLGDRFEQTDLNFWTVRAGVRLVF